MFLGTCDRRKGLGPARGDGAKDCKIVEPVEKKMEVMNRLQMSFSAPAPVWKARSSWARATIAMETTEQKICWPWEDKKERCFRKKKQPPAEARDKDGYYDGYFCGVRETDADSVHRS